MLWEKESGKNIGKESGKNIGKESGKNIGKYISLDGTAPGFGGGSKSQVFRISPGDGLKIHLLCAALTDI